MNQSMYKTPELGFSSQIDRFVNLFIIVSISNIFILRETRNKRWKHEEALRHGKKKDRTAKISILIYLKKYL